MFCGDPLENIIVVIKDCQWIAAQDINDRRLSYFSPVLFELQCLSYFTFRQEKRWAFPTNCNAGHLFSLRRLGGCFNQVTRSLKKPSLVRYLIDHKSGQGLANIQWDQDAPLNHIINIYALGVQLL